MRRRQGPPDPRTLISKTVVQLIRFAIKEFTHGARRDWIGTAEFARSCQDRRVITISGQLDGI